MALPLKYYNNNLVGTLNLLDSMGRAGCKRVRFALMLCAALRAYRRCLEAPTSAALHARARHARMLGARMRHARALRALRSAALRTRRIALAAPSLLTEHAPSCAHPFAPTS